MTLEKQQIGRAFNAAIDFALDGGAGYEGLVFLRMWREGDWDGIRKEFPDFDLSTVINDE